MISNMYWITALMFTAVLCIIAIAEKHSVNRHTRYERSFTDMLFFGIFFCFQDMFWGFCDSKIIDNDTVYFVASSIFHFSIVFTSFFWMKFFLSYMGVSVRRKKMFYAVVFLAVGFQLVVITVNFFYPVLFVIENGHYFTRHLRHISFSNQFLIYLITAITGLYHARSDDPKWRHQFFTISFISLIPLITGIFQLCFSEAPFFSLGYFLICFTVHYFIVSKERNEAYHYMVANAITGTYYTMHLFNLTGGSFEPVIESEMIKKLIANKKDLQGTLNTVMDATVTDAYREMVMEFVNLNTLSDRLQSSNQVSLDFVGKYHGWVRASFTTVERDDDGSLISAMFTTQIIDDQKKKEQEMFARSTTDQLTEVHNRRAYEEDIPQLPSDSQNMVYVSIDVNGLKMVNDTLGHAAGDELLLGAAGCMKQCFGPYGKIYRTGGDEFAVIMYASDSELKEIEEDFTDAVDEWKGSYVDSLAVSCGYVQKKEFPEASVAEIAKIADDRMYKAKAAFYQKKGLDRRGQHEAHKALCALYTKILRINLTDDSFNVVNMNMEEMTVSQGYAESISGWLKGFCLSGSVHPDDVNSYLKQTDLAYLRSYFAEGNKTLSILYRRKFSDEFRHVVMEMIPAGDYAPDNQSLFLYVKEIGIMPQWL